MCAKTTNTRFICRADRRFRKYTGYLCGLGYDVVAGGPAYPDNDMEIPFDVAFTEEDLLDVSIGFHPPRKAARTVLKFSGVFLSWEVITGHWQCNTAPTETVETLREAAMKRCLSSDTLVCDMYGFSPRQGPLTLVRRFCADIKKKGANVDKNCALLLPDKRRAH